MRAEWEYALWASVGAAYLDHFDSRFILTAMPSIKQNTKKSRHDPLLVQLQGDEQEAKYGHISQPGRRKKSLKNAIVEEDEAEVLFFAESLAMNWILISTRGCSRS